MAVRIRDLLKVLKSYGITVEKPSSGSHWKLRRAGARVYIVPIHGGLGSEADPKYITSLCRHFGIERSELMARLQG